MLKAVTFGAAAALALTAANEHDSDREQVIKELTEKLKFSKGTWKAGMNPRFRGQPVGAAKDLCGVKLDNMDILKGAIKLGDIEVVEAPAGFAPPDSFDSETNWPACAKVISDIRDQSNCGCCWAFGGASAASDRLCIATNVTAPLSAEDVCFCASSDGCGGGYLQDSWSHMKNGVVTGGNQDGTGPLADGWCSAFSMPHCHHHGPQGQDPYPAEGTPGCPSQNSAKCPKACDAGAKAPHNVFSSDKYKFSGSVQNYQNEAAVQAAIMSAGPVESAFTVYSDFENYVSGVYKQTSTQVLGGHAIRIVGWGVDNNVKYWKVANSWNPFWGENGYFRILRGKDECGIESQAMANGPGKWSGPGL